jgi:hypothetical protein
MPRRSSHYRDCDDDKHRRKCDRYKSKKSSRRESSDSSLSSYSTNNSCNCSKCSKEIKNEKPKIVFCNREPHSIPDDCDKSVVIVINMK